jgi:hypothetical protein
MVLPVRKTNRSHSPSGLRPSAHRDQAIGQATALHADATPLAAWRLSVVRATALSTKMIMWPDVPFTMWQDAADGSPERCANWYRDFLEATCPQLFDVEPRLADTDYLLGRLY